MKKVFSSFILCMGLVTVIAQNVGIGTNAPTASAMLDVSSTNKGILIPRMTAAQRKAIPSPAQGLLVYDLDKSTVFMYDGVKWVPMMFAANEEGLAPLTRKSNDGVSGDFFGYSVCISGDYAIAGLQPNANAIGAAYIFYRNGGVWQQQAKLTANDATVGNGFGVSVGISGNEAIVGANAIGSGAAYIFSRNGTAWTQTAKLTASDGAANDNFGFSVSIGGNYAIVGAPFDDISASVDQGSTYIFFKGAGWANSQAHQAKLTAPGGLTGDNFGRSVSISGDYALVGAPATDNGANTDEGAAYVFGRVGANWPNLAKLTGLASANRWFGSSVSISGDYAIVGAPYNPVPSYDNNVSGTSLIFYGGAGWSNGMAPQANLSSTNPYTGANDRFGYSVSINGDYAIVGSYSYDAGVNINQGNTHLYKRNGNTWVFVRKIEDGSPQYVGTFGYGVTINGFNIIISAPGKNASTGEISFLNIE